MKRTFALILALTLALSLTACGGDGSPGGGPAPEDISGPGSYVPMGLVPGTSYEVNENGSYDHGEEKGTYTAAEDNSLTFQPKDGSSSTLTACGAYYHTAAKMTEDTEYGLAPAFDENGHSNQTFQTEADGLSLTLELHEDGTYVFSYSRVSPVFDKFFDVVTCEGTYALEDTVLMLTSNEHAYPFLFVEEAIYPVVYGKKTESNGADAEAAQAAVLAAEETAAQGRWWTPADEETAAAVRAALAGTWFYTDGYGNYQLTFSETGVSVHMDFMGMTALNSSGTYTIQNGAILLEYKSQSGGYNIINHRAVPYTLADGSLVLYEMLDMMNEEGLPDAGADLTAISSYQYQKTA